MKKRCKWNIPPKSPSEAESLAKKLNILPKTAQLLINRGLGDEKDAYDILNKRTDTFHDPFLLCDMDKAVLRLHSAIENNEHITVYGDYDVDGITATSSLITYLRGYTDNISYYIPSRSAEGYGVNSDAIEKLHLSGTDLLITVDTGITAIDEVAYAATLGMDVIVTDHHQCRETLPNASAVVNPKRPDSKYPFSELAGVGVVFKLCCAYEIYRRTSDLFCDGGKQDTVISAVRYVASMLCDLVSIGTVADVMPVTDENRLIVTAGLYLIPRTKNIGLRALLKECYPDGLKKPMTTGAIGFILAPRINAMGRMSEAGDAVQMFLTDDVEFAANTARTLCIMNTERQQEETRIADEAEQIIKNRPELIQHKMLVLSGEGWHHGVIGIVASRLTEKYFVPTVLVCFDAETGIGKGSGRSIPGFDLVGALSAHSDLLEKYGGHKAAAGLAVCADKFDEFSSSIIEYADGMIPDECTVSVDIDEELGENDITAEFVNELALLEPCGLGNPTPLFMLRDVGVIGASATASGTHTRLTLDISGKSVTAMYFNTECEKLPLLPAHSADVLFNLSFNEYAGKKAVQLTLKDCRLSGDGEEEYDSDTELFYDILSDRIYPEKRYIPSRTDIGALYRHLRTLSCGNACTVNTLKVSETLGAPVVKILLMYTVLTQLGLIDCAENGRYSYEIKVIDGKEKTQLENSELYLRLISYDD